MKETMHDRPQHIPLVECEHCTQLNVNRRYGDKEASQLYKITLTRKHLTREWVFCSLECLRNWAEPLR